MRLNEPQIENTTDKPKEGSRQSSLPNTSPDESDDDSDGSLDPDTLVPNFIELQSRLFEIQPDLFCRPKKGKKSARGKTDTPTDDPRANKLQRKIGAIESDVLFDQNQAEVKWQEKLHNLRKDAEFLRPKSKEHEEPTSGQADSQQPSTTEKDSGNAISPGEDGNEEEGGLLGDMFGNEEPVLETGVITEELNAAAITLRDFGKWTGLSPRRVLEETCKAR